VERAGAKVGRVVPLQQSAGFSAPRPLAPSPKPRFVAWQPTRRDVNIGLDPITAVATTLSHALVS
jgi:hypothetical protein